MTADEVYRKALDLTLSYEGGMSLSPKDPGNWTGGAVGEGELKGTNRGVTQTTYSAWRYGQGQGDADVSGITEREVQAIYRSYWDAIKGDDLAALSPGLAVVAFDIAINSGPGRALQWLAEGADTPVALTARRLEHLVGLSIWPEYSRGWSRRAYGVLGVADRLERSEA